jgi:hypothetical protein
MFVNLKIFRDLIQRWKSQTFLDVNVNVKHLIRVAGHDLVNAHSAFRAVCNYRALLSAAVIDWKEYFFLNVQFLNDKNRLAELSFRVLGVWGAKKELSTHLASNVFDLLNWFNNVNPWS